MAANFFQREKSNKSEEGDRVSYATKSLKIHAINCTIFLKAHQVQPHSRRVGVETRLLLWKGGM